MSLKEFRQACAARAVSRESSLRGRIDLAVRRVLEKHPEVTEVKLTGSYASGAYIDEDTDPNFVALKKQVLGISKISDIDFVTVPRMFDLFVSKDGFKIHCNPFVYPGTPVIAWYSNQ